MNNPPASDLHPIKSVLRTAFLGVKPAEQVMLKGYLRIILRLEVDLQWVSPKNPQVDLYFIDNSLRNSDEVIKLAKSHSSENILYVQRGKSDSDRIDNKLLLLPLTKTKILTDWLFQNISILIKNPINLDEETSVNFSHDNSNTEVQPTRKNATQRYAKRLRKSTKRGLAQLKNTSFLKNKSS